MFPFAEDIKGGDHDPKRQSKCDESAQIAHAVGVWIGHKGLLGVE
jgi:hypothetical protein